MKFFLSTKSADGACLDYVHHYSSSRADSPASGQFNTSVTFQTNPDDKRLRGVSIPWLEKFLPLCPPVLSCTICGDPAMSQENRTGVKGMSQFIRGMKVTTVFGEGTVVNLPVSNRIAVQYETGEIRYFWPEDVVTGRIRPAA